MVQWVKDQVWSLQQLRSLLRGSFDPWQVRPKKKGKEGKKEKELAHMLVVPTPATLPSLSKPALWPSGELPMISSQKKEKACLQVVLHNMQMPPKSEQLQHYSPPLGHP